jgi:GAF domain-containing protein
VTRTHLRRPNIRGAAALQTLEREQGVLVQPDVLAPDPAPPKGPPELYGFRAQMLHPVALNGALAGILAVHQADAPCQWTASEEADLRATAQRIVAILERSDWRADLRTQA